MNYISIYQAQSGNILGKMDIWPQVGGGGGGKLGGYDGNWDGENQGDLRRGVEESYSDV